MKKTITLPKVIIAIIILFALFWVGSILKCEIQTLIHLDEFGDKWTENTMLGEPDRLIVLKYSDNYAELYHKNEHGGNVISFKRNDVNEEWSYNGWKDTVWSRYGSADDFIWPYIR
ncbi:MAG: hypothetical protein E7627_08665 [Ruminococcaceae bacterium]|nr:hypothetical protein [Oscillospiraceae bacterium]